MALAEETKKHHCLADLAVYEDPIDGCTVHGRCWMLEEILLHKRSPQGYLWVNPTTETVIYKICSLARPPSTHNYLTEPGFYSILHLLPHLQHEM
jgi:hypothetical protein